MTAARSRVRSISPASFAITLLLAACDGSTATTAPSAGGSTPGATVGRTEAPSVAALASAAVTVPPVTAPPVTEPPVTVPPITEPPVTAPPPSIAPGIGVKLLIGDQQYMTVLAAEQWAGTSSVKPRSGKAFFTVSIRIDAIKLTSFDSADFKLQDAAGKSYAWRTGRSPHLYDLANMTSGSNYVGWITYEVPKTSLGKLTLVYKPRFLGGPTFTVPLS